MKVRIEMMSDKKTSKLVKNQQKPIELNLFSDSAFAPSDNVETELSPSDNVEHNQGPLDKQEAKEDLSEPPYISYVSDETIALLFLRLSHSKFRSSFYLNQKDREIINNKGLATIREHARQIIAKRLAPAVIPNDGKQTPMRHGTSPVFIAQHATGCCCRGCLEKWHHIPKGRALDREEQEYVVEVIMHWIESKCSSMR